MAIKLRPFILPIFLLLLLSSVVTPAVYGQSPGAWINEIGLSENTPGNAEPFVEVSIDNSFGSDLSAFALTLYGGTDGSPVGSHPLDTFTRGETTGNYTFYYKRFRDFPREPAGFLLEHEGTPVQFVSLGNKITARDGVADGETSDIITPENTGNPTGGPLRLAGSGLAYADFYWQEGTPDGSTPGRLNTGQSLLPTVQFANSSLSAYENQGNAVLSISLSNPDGNPVSVDVIYRPGAGSAGANDITGAARKTVTFPAGSENGTLRTASFKIHNDTDYEGEETAVFELANLSTTGAARIGRTGLVHFQINDNDRPDLAINEILVDPSGDVDNNGSVNNRYDDQFIEIVNNETREVDISGWTFSDNGSDIRHTFPRGTVLPPSGALVLFSRDTDGGPAGVFGDASVQISDNSLNLDTDGDSPTLYDARNSVIDRYTYGSEAGDGQSLVRYPEGSGDFVLHSAVSSSRFSPGTRVGGINFSNSITLRGNGGWRLLSTPPGGMRVNELSDDLSIRGYAESGPENRVNMFTGYDGTQFTSVADIDNAELQPGSGFMIYLSGPEDGGAGTIPVTLAYNAGTDPDRDVTVELHRNGDGVNLLGNPFESPIDISELSTWTSGGTLKSGIGQIWDDETGSYILSTTLNGRIPPWKGFFVENTDARSLEIPSSARVKGKSAYKESDQEGYLALTLGSADSPGEITDQASVLYFHEGARHGWDRFDATKLLPLVRNYAILEIVSAGDNGVSAKAQDSRPYDFRGEISYDLQLNRRGIGAGKFEITWSKVNIPDSWNFTLIDNLTGTEVDMNNSTRYSFAVSSRDKRASSVDRQNRRSLLPLSGAITAGTRPDEEPRFTIKAVAGNHELQSEDIPETVQLNQNYPNPFNPSTTISFELAEQAEVTLSVFTIVGQKVATLVDGTREAGVHQEVWSAADMPSGIYIAQLEVNGKVYIRKMTLIK